MKDKTSPNILLQRLLHFNHFAEPNIPDNCKISHCRKAVGLDFLYSDHPRGMLHVLGFWVNYAQRPRSCRQSMTPGVSGSWDLCSYKSSDIHPSRVQTSLTSIPFKPPFLTHLQPSYSFLLTCFLTPSTLILHFTPAHQLSIGSLSFLVLTVQGWESEWVVYFKPGHVAPYQGSESTI